MAMLSFNLLLKVVISSSAALLWSLVHVLQVFRYILMINIRMPLLVDTLMGFLAVVVGEVDEMEELVPDLLNDYLLNASLPGESVLYPRFEDNGKVTSHM